VRRGGWGKSMRKVGKESQWSLAQVSVPMQFTQRICYDFEMGSPVTTGDGGPLAVWNRTLADADLSAVMEDACEKVAEGWSLTRYAKSKRYPMLMFVAWVESDPEREAMYRAALKLAAEYYADKVVECAETASIENYQVRRMQAHVYQWVASKHDRTRFGDDKSQSNTLQIGKGAGTISISFVDAEDGKPKGITYDAEG
jgi:hypothetical protein